MKAEEEGEISPQASGREEPRSAEEGRVLEVSSSQQQGKVLEVSASNPEPAPAQQPSEEDQTELLEDIDESELEESLEQLSDEELESLADKADEEDVRQETIARAKAIDYNDPFQRIRRVPPYPYRVRDDFSNEFLDDLNFRERYQRPDDEDYQESAEIYGEIRQLASKLDLEEGDDEEDFVADREVVLDEEAQDGDELDETLEETPEQQSTNRTE